MYSTLIDYKKLFKKGIGILLPVFARKIRLNLQLFAKFIEANQSRNFDTYIRDSTDRPYGKNTICI